MAPYLGVLCYFVLVTTLGCVILLLASVVSPARYDLQKVTAYECGFDPFGHARAPFDVAFYLVAILFLVFDLEVAFLLPWAVAGASTGATGLWVLLGFLVVVTLGFVYEWLRGALDWSSRRAACSMDGVLWAPELYLSCAVVGVLLLGVAPLSRPSPELWGLCLVDLHLVAGGTVMTEPGSGGGVRPAGPSSVLPALGMWAALSCWLAALLVWASPQCPGVEPGAAFAKDTFAAGTGTAGLVFAGLCFLLVLRWSTCAGAVQAEYVSLVLLAVLGMLLLCYATDLVSVYLCLELQSFALVVLSGLHTSSAYAVEAAMKLFLLAAFASALLLLGTGLLYWSLGTTQLLTLTELSLVLDSGGQCLPVAALVGCWLVGVAILWKLGAAPLHFWVADVYQGSWTSVALVLSTLPKLVLLGTWVHQLQALWSLTLHGSLPWVCGSSLLVGALAPLAQGQLKRLLAYSSVGHVGFMLLPLVSLHGSQSLWLYLAYYGAASLCVWGLLMWPAHRRLVGPVPGRASPGCALLGQAHLHVGPQYLWDLAGFSQAQPGAAAVWALAVLSMAGLPPAGGFLAKASLLWPALLGGQHVLVSLALLATLVSCLYYWQVVRVCYVPRPTLPGYGHTAQWATHVRLCPLASYVVACGGLFMACGLWYNGPLTLLAHLHELRASH